MISLVGDCLIIAGTWALMGQYPKIDNMPLALYTRLQMLHPMVALLLPIGIVLALIGRALFVIRSHHKVRAFFSALLLIGRLPFIEGAACMVAFALLQRELTPAETAGMLMWIAITLTIGIVFMMLARKVDSQTA